MLRLDGIIIEKSESKQFDSIMFGDGCTDTCGSDSNEDAPESSSSSLVEFFMHRVSSYDCENEPDFNWTVKTMGSSNSWTTVSEGWIPACSNTSLYHEAICVPNDQCTSFSISSPKSREFVAPPYKVTMDGIVYTFKEMNIDNNSSDFSGLEQTTLMGGCSVDAVCDDKSNQALFQLDVTTPSEYLHEDTTSLAAIPENFEWILASQPGTASNYSLSSLSHFGMPTSDINSVYRTIECVAVNDECELVFNFTSNFDAEYELKRNGILLPSDTNLFGEDCGASIENARDENNVESGSDESGGAGSVESSDGEGDNVDKTSSDDAGNGSGSMAITYSSIGSILLLGVVLMCL